MKYGREAASHESVRTGSQEGPPASGRIPDFFIIGHQKCGTTALHEMLSLHPQIFMPYEKEPRYFATDLRSRLGQRETPGRPLTLEGYLRLFSDATPEQRIGEASPQYIRSRVAPRAIAEAQPTARIVAVLREPAAFLRSFHLQSVQNHLETETDLANALALEANRREGRDIPPRCHQPQALLYSNHVRYAQQLQAYFAAFPRENVLVLIYEDLREDNEGVVRELLRFLDVQDDVPIEVVETERLRHVRSRPLHELTGVLRAARRNQEAASPAWRVVSRLTPEPMRRGVLGKAWRRAVYTDRSEQDPELMLALRRRFKPEVEKLGELLGRDMVARWGYQGI